MTDIVKGILEDTRKGILLNNFDGGIVTDTGGLSLASNQSPDALNVFAWEGNLHFRGGFASWCTLPAGTDGAFTYTDVNDNAHMVEWAGGSMYDVSAGGSPVLIRANCYSPGQTIAHAQLNGRLYWATLTVPLRQWDGTTEQAVTNAGGIGVVPPPACSFLVALNGALVAVDYVVAGIRQAGAFIWCDVNNPNKWVGANTQTVGSNDGGICVFAIVMGVAQVGVAPIKQFMVGKNNRQIFLYEGALGSLTENAVSSPVGIIDGQTAVYMPTKQGLGAVMFLGDDAQFYLCNGIECTVASENIKLLTNNLVNAAYELNPGQRFNAVYNQRFQYYLCDFGNNTQLAYKWDTGAWWLFQGWPSGVYATMPTNNGLPTIFVGANFGSTTGVYELALDQTDDNGTDITAYWTSPYIHGGKPERLKIYQEVTLFAYNIGVQYAVTGYGFPRSDGVVPQTTTMLMNDPAVGATPILSGSVWGQFYWGQGYWTGGQPTSLTQPYSIGGVKSPLIVPSVATKWARAGVPQPFRSGGAQFKIAWNGGVPDFRVTSFKIALLFQNEAVGVLPFSGQGQVTNVAPNWGNRFTNRGAPTSTPPHNVPVPSHHGGGAFLPGLSNPAAYGLMNNSGLYQLVGWDSSGHTAALTFDPPVALSGLDNTMSSTTNGGPYVYGTGGVAFGIADVTTLIGSDQSTEVFAVAPTANGLTGVFKTPGGMYQDNAVRVSSTQQMVALNHAATHLYYIAQDPAGTASAQVFKVNMTTGAIDAATTLVGFVSTRLASLVVSTDDSKIFAWSSSFGAGTQATVYAFDAATLGTLGSTTLSVGDSPVDCALSPDGTKLAIICCQIPSGPPTTLVCYIFDTTAYTTTNFSGGTTAVTDLRASIAFPKADSGNVLIAYDTSVNTYSTGGVAGTVYSNVIANGSGTRCIVNIGVDQTTGVMLGTSTENHLVAPFTVWSYKLTTQTRLSEVATSNLVLQAFFSH